MATKKQIKDDILFGVEIGLSLVSLYVIWRTIKGPDAGREMKMRLARGVENFCVHQGTVWMTLADKAEHVYRNSTMVTS